MPDQFGFDHLGSYHRCIWCEWPGYGHNVPDAERQKHARKHERERKKEIEQQRKENLAKARKLKRQSARENDLAYGEEVA